MLFLKGKHHVTTYFTPYIYSLIFSLPLIDLFGSNIIRLSTGRVFNENVAFALGAVVARDVSGELPEVF